MIEAASECGLDIRKVAKRRPHLEARQHFAQRTEGSVVTRRPISTARIAAFCHIEWSAAERSLALPGEIRIVPLELFDQWSDETNELQEYWIDSKHDETPR